MIIEMEREKIKKMRIRNLDMLLVFLGQNAYLCPELNVDKYHKSQFQNLTDYSKQEILYKLRQLFRVCNSKFINSASKYDLEKFGNSMKELTAIVNYVENLPIMDEIELYR